ncbi:MAG: Gfo/Idh/MocA family oxidoreductase [Candidatus Latescibacterota bacterium]|nr:Gfo/Idh/MocA family oxidoreductase [Candidatus Latescibacterota bacterium]
MSTTYKAAAIGRTGAGNFGHGLHLAYQDNLRVEFVAVADPDEKGRSKAQQESGALRAYADYTEMLAEEELDIVSVCPRWTDCHREMVLACLEAGAHVYCEKPITANLAEGDEIVDRADALGKKIAVSHQGVYLPNVQLVKKLLDEGKIGDVQAIYAHGKQDRRGGGEDMITLGTHLFNMMRYFAGPVSWMSAHVTTDGREIEPGDVRDPTEPVGLVAGDCVNSYFAFASGVAGFFDSRKDQAGEEGHRMGMDILGSQGIISIGGGSGTDPTLYPHTAFRPTEGDKKWVPIGEPFTGELLHLGNQLAIIDLIDAIESDREPISSGRGAVAALEMILGAYESQISGARVIFPMANREHPLVRFAKAGSDVR